MRVSVLIAAYNYARFLPDVLGSVLGQTYEGEMECIVVDDGSTDNTMDVLNRYEDAITAVRQQNLGQAAAFNTAYRISKGDILCFLDADDVWYPYKVERVVQEFRSHPDTGLVHHALRVVDQRGEEVAGFFDEGARAHGDVRALMRRKVLRWMFAPTSGLCLRRSVASIVFPLRTGLRISADELVAPVAALLAPVRYIPEVLGLYRLHGHNTWASRRREPTRLWAERYMAVLEEKVCQANEAAARAGYPLRLSPWMKWDYVKAASILHATSPLRYLPRAVLTVARARGLRWTEKAELVSAITRKSFRHHRRTRRPGRAPHGET